MTAYLSYCDDWETTPLHCRQCGWTGTFRQGAVEYWDALVDCHCPCCDVFTAPMLAVISHPTIEETVGHKEQLSSGDRSLLHQVLSFRLRRSRTTPLEKQRWPVIKADSFELQWDMRGREPACETVIRHGRRILHREPALFEGLPHYASCARQLRRHYGQALRDLEPTDASKTYLYGDDLLAPERLEQLRAEVFGG